MSVVPLETEIPNSQLPRFAEPHECEAQRSFEIRQGCYIAQLAQSDAERIQAFHLRFLVFNVELNEGLETAYAIGQDLDKFDAFCDHLVVKDLRTARVIGTYRLQTGAMAAANAGFYSAQEFDFNPYQTLGDELIELGRACVHRDHRSVDVLYLLWRGIAQYAARHRARYLIGCSSLTSQDPAHGAAVYAALQRYLVEPQLRTIPHPDFALRAADPRDANDTIPKLLRTYLAVGAKICSPPAIDREFKTIDFLTFLDLQTLHPRVRARFLNV